MREPFCIWLTGLPAAGKTTIAAAVSLKLTSLGIKHEWFDGDRTRQTISRGLGFSKEDRIENIRRIIWVTSKVMKYGGSCIASYISPYKSVRQEARLMLSQYGKFVEVFVNTPLDTCIERDPKGMYKRAKAGEILEFTGISAPYEEPDSPDLELETVMEGVWVTVDQVMFYLNHVGLLEKKVPRALYIGRWQPFHKGHDEIVRESLKKGIPVAIGVRDTPISEFDPYSLEDRIRMIKAIYQGDDVIVFPVSDIESINIGRKVGYTVIRYEEPKHIEVISATEIRKLVKSGVDGWKSKVPERAIEIIEEIEGRKSD